MSFLSSAIDFVIENPVKTALIVGGGALACTYAAPIAMAIGKTGVLGKATTGTAIKTLNGAALDSASKYAISKAIGCSSVAAGKGVIAGSGSAITATITKDV